MIFAQEYTLQACFRGLLNTKVTKVFPIPLVPKGGSIETHNKKTTFSAEFCNECCTLYLQTKNNYI